MTTMRANGPSCLATHGGSVDGPSGRGVACTSRPAARTDKLRGAGIRSSTYGRPDDPGPGYWARTGTEIAAKLPRTKPEAIWIVSRLEAAAAPRCRSRSRPGAIRSSPGCPRTSASPCSGLFDGLGYRVWLQTEPGRAARRPGLPRHARPLRPPHVRDRSRGRRRVAPSAQQPRPRRSGDRRDGPGRGWRRPGRTTPPTACS
ncbi:MAG: hypothetical protein M0C28_25425 [Candidatus Moduliflexus flocculans]|nr:hypothetical protein [Candidatus Moduliflexus flocculans]